MHATDSSYPASFTFDAPERIANWRPLVQWLLAIPHLAVVYVRGSVSGILAIISRFAVLFTGRLPAGLANFQAMSLRCYLRTVTYAGFLRDEYPPFGFATTPADPGDDPLVGVDLVPQLEDRNRLTTAFRLILAIPRLIVMSLLGIALCVVGLIACFAVLFTARWPQGLRDFALGVGGIGEAVPRMELVAALVVGGRLLLVLGVDLMQRRVDVQDHRRGARRRRTAAVPSASTTGGLDAPIFERVAFYNRAGRHRALGMLSSRARTLDVAVPGSSIVGGYLPFTADADHPIAEDSDATPL